MILSFQKEQEPNQLPHRAILTCNWINNQKTESWWHLGLPQRDVKKVIELGWGELHPVVHKGWLPPNFIMVYAPRNEEEADEIKKIIFRSYQFAIGEISD